MFSLVGVLLKGESHGGVAVVVDFGGGSPLSDQDLYDLGPVVHRRKVKSSSSL